MQANPAQQLHQLGQSVWYDNISREILDNGELKRLVTEWGVRGLTSNPTIFDNALSKGTSYDAQIAELRGKGLSTGELFEELALVDIAAAADLLKPIYEQSEGTDGFVSIEVSPLLARDTQGTVEEARRLSQRLARPNIMIKIPGTAEGLPAVKAVLAEGISVNITLLFSPQNYLQVAQTYCEALMERVARNQPISHIRSVASFFVSRVDTIVDSKLKEIITASEKTDATRAEAARGLIGKFGVANCRIVYDHFCQLFHGPEFEPLRRAGAAVQRPLWASTSTKDPAYRDVIYVEELIGAETVNTMPHPTLAAFVDHGIAQKTLDKNVGAAKAIPQELAKVGVEVEKCLAFLQVDGVDKFSKSFVALNETLKKKI